MNQPDCDICSDCKEHCDFELETDGEDGYWLSNCCGAGPYSYDPDFDLER